MIQLKPWIDLWDSYSNLKQTRLLRLSLLRDLAALLHSEKSRSMVLGSEKELPQLEELTGRLQALRKSRLEKPLKNLLETESLELNPDLEDLPEELSSKLNRFDRRFEKTMTAEALRIGWQINFLDAWVEIQEAEHWHHRLTQELPPRGVLLFAESAPESSEKPPVKKPEIQFWHGRWHCALEPGFHPTLRGLRCEFQIFSSKYSAPTHKP